MSAEEYLKKVSPNDKYGVRANLEQSLLLKPVLGVMEKYAEAYLKQKVSEITDEEIHDAFPFSTNIDAYNFEQRGKMQGAKWFKEKLLNKVK